MPRTEYALRNSPESLAANPWSRLSSADEPLFRRHIRAHALPSSYEHCWAFITQQARLCGYKALHKGVLSVAAIKDPRSPFAFLLPPIGPSQAVLDQLPRLAARLVEMTERRVVLRKAPAAWEAELGLRGFRRVPPSAFAIAAEYPEDVYPQLVLDTAVAGGMAQPKLQKTRNQLNVLHRSHDAGVEVMCSRHRALLGQLIDRWAGTRNRNAGGDADERGRIADPDAYHCLVNAFAHRVDDRSYFGLVMFVDEQPSGFCFAERSGPHSAALYASLAHRGVRGASEFLLVSFLSHLAGAGIRSINLGGSETLGLFRFKRKFAPAREISTVELEFEP